MKEYMVLWGSGNSFQEANDSLARQVEEALADDWDLQGGVSTLIDCDNTFCMFQALIR